MRQNLTRPTDTTEPIVEDGGRMIKALMIAPPVIGIVILIILLLILVPLTPSEVSIIGDTFVICFVLLPAFICLLPVYFILVVAAIFVGKLNNVTGSKLGAVESATEKIADTVNNVGRKVGAWSIAWRTRFAFVNHIVQDWTNRNS